MCTVESHTVNAPAERMCTIIPKIWMFLTFLQDSGLPFRFQTALNTLVLLDYIKMWQNLFFFSFQEYTSCSFSLVLHPKVFVQQRKPATEYPVTTCKSYDVQKCFWMTGVNTSCSLVCLQAIAMRVLGEKVSNWPGELKPASAHIRVCCLHLDWLNCSHRSGSFTEKLVGN